MGRAGQARQNRNTLSHLCTVTLRPPEHSYQEISALSRVLSGSIVETGFERKPIETSVS